MTTLRAYTILDRYLWTNLFQTIVFMVLMFTVIWLCPETLFKLIQYVFGGKIELSQAATMLMYHIPPVLQQSIPIAVMVGAILLFRKFSLSSEIIAISSSGISQARIMLPVILMGLLFGMTHFAIQEWVTPNTSPKLERLYYESNLKPKKDDNFVYVEKNRLGQLDKFMLIGQTQKDKLQDFIFLYYTDTQEGGVQISRILRAPEGHWSEKDRAWKLYKGVDYGLDQQGVYHEIHRFEEQWVNTSKFPAKLLKYSKINPINMKLKSLKEYIHLLYEGGQLQDVRFCEVRLFQKWAFPIASVFFALFGALLGIERIRSNSNLGLIYGAIVLFIYSILIPFATNMGSLGLLDPFAAAWLPLGITSIAAILILQSRRWEGA